MDEKKLMKTAKDTVKIGATVMVGQGLISQITNIPGMPAQAKSVAHAAGTGLNLVAIGQLGKTGLTFAGEINPIKKVKPKSDSEKRIEKMLKR